MIRRGRGTCSATEMGAAAPPTTCNLNTQHSTLNTQHWTFNTQHSTLHLPPATWTHNTQHSTLQLPPETWTQLCTRIRNYLSLSLLLWLYFSNMVNRISTNSCIIAVIGVCSFAASPGLLSNCLDMTSGFSFWKFLQKNVEAPCDGVWPPAHPSSWYQASIEFYHNQTKNQTLTVWYDMNGVGKNVKAYLAFL